MATPPPNLPLDPLPMKAPLSIHSRILSGLVGFCLLGATGCINKPAARPSQLYSNAGSNMGGPMRVAVDTPTPRTPPHLPIMLTMASNRRHHLRQHSNLQRFPRSYLLCRVRLILISLPLRRSPRFWADSSTPFLFHPLHPLLPPQAVRSIRK